MFKSKKAYIHHPLVLAFLAGVVFTIIFIYLMNKGMIPGVNFRFC